MIVNAFIVSWARDWEARPTVSKHSGREQGQVDGVGHLLISGAVEVKLIAAVVRNDQLGPSEGAPGSIGHRTLEQPI
jgi:hypothetical protein